MPFRKELDAWNNEQAALIKLPYDASHSPQNLAAHEKVIDYARRRASEGFSEFVVFIGGLAAYGFSRVDDAKAEARRVRSSTPGANVRIRSFKIPRG